jgi:parallel beta-helix repeat protein
VTIAGRTEQPGYAGTPLIAVAGGGGSFAGLVLGPGSRGSTIQGLTIEGFGGDGILVESSDNMIGGTAAGAGDVISGNSGGGIHIGQGSAGNTVVGDLIGTDITGTSAVPNTTGIWIDGASRNTIGGLSPSDANVISGNDAYGIRLTGSTATGNLVLGNLIGINKRNQELQAQPVSQTSGMPVGILIEDAPANTIGGTAPGARNTITGFGVAIDISSVNAVGNLIEGDWIGSDLGGNPLPDSVGTGVYLNNAPNNIVGGNTIQGYANSGVNLYGAQAQGNVIQGNVIQGNRVGLAGIVVEDAVNNTLAGNTITGNGYAGIYLFGQRISVTNALISSIADNDLLDNTQYGILLTDVAKARGYKGLLTSNHFAGNGINPPVGVFTGSGTSGGSSLPAAHSKAHKRLHQAASHPTRKHRVRTRPAARDLAVPSAERPGGGPAARRPLHDPAATTGPAPAVPRRRVQPAANIPRGPLAHHAAARLNPPRSAGAHAGRASGRSAS